MKALGFGAVLWDNVITSGSRKSPGAFSRMTIGGSVFNVLGHLSKLGNSTYMLSAIGNDGLGERTKKEFYRLGIHSDFLQKSEYPTCCVTITHDKNGFPEYKLPDDVSWDYINIHDSELEKINTDYSFDYFIYGTIEQRNIVSRRSLRYILETLPSTKKYLDLTLRENFHDEQVLKYSLEKADIIKMNLEEAWIVNSVFRFNVNTTEEILKRIIDNFKSEIAVITCGEKGAYIGNEEKLIFKPGYKIVVGDTVGSGDAFSAGLLYMLSKDETLDSACDFGNKLGAVIASKYGAIPDYTIDDLKRLKMIP